MKSIILKRIELTNFKGIAHRVEEFQDHENWIIGANATGKTSIFDAFTWLLFGKDSNGQSEEKAKIKMLDKDGKPVWNTDNSVEATFIVDGQELTLKRIYKEKWRKPQGQAEKIYDGQTTVFSWNGNEKISATEYKKRVNDLIDEELFKLITDPLYFANLDPKKRREIVLGMAGDISEEEIKAANPELAIFEPGQSVEEKRNVAMSTRLRTIKERDNYPARIDEQMQLITAKEAQIAEMQTEPKEVLEAKAEELQNKIKSVDDKLMDVQAIIQEAVNSSTARIKALEEIENYKRLAQSGINQEVELYNATLDKYKVQAQGYETEIRSIQSDIAMQNGLLEEDRKQLADIQAQMNTIKAEKEPEIEEAICPMCKRPLDAEDQETHRHKLHENWIINQNRELEALQRKGDTIYEGAKRRKDMIKNLQYQMEEAKANLTKATELASQPRREAIAINFDEDETLQDMIARVPAEINATEATRVAKEKLQAEKDAYVKELEAIRESKEICGRMAAIKMDIRSSKARIELLEKEQLEVNQRIADQERIIYLCDLWTKTRTEILNAKVSDKFNLVKFKMFNYTQEGNPVPVCEITVNGVDYSALNTAATINAGLDIINALIKYYDVKAPIFIDNRESVTNINAPETQIINLSVK